MRGRVPELDALLREGERPRDERLRRDDGGRGGDHEERHLERRRGEQIERIARRGRIAEQQRALAEVVQEQRGKHDAEPGDADGPLAEVPHVGVERLTAGDAEHDGAEGEKAGEAVRREERDAVPRVERREHLRRLRDGPRAERGDRDEPGEHQRAERRPHARRPEALHHEQREEDDHGDRHDEVAERRGAHLQPFHGAEHGDRRRDDAVAVEQRGAEEAERDEHQSPLAVLDALAVLKQEGEQGENAPLAPIVRAQDEDDVLDADDEDERPDDQREDADDVRRGRHDAVLLPEALAKGVQRARSDVAVNDAERGEGEYAEAPARRGGVLRLVIELGYG